MHNIYIKEEKQRFGKLLWTLFIIYFSSIWHTSFISELFEKCIICNQYILRFKYASIICHVSLKLINKVKEIINIYWDSKILHLNVIIHLYATPLLFFPHYLKVEHLYENFHKSKCDKAKKQLPLVSMKISLSFQTKKISS